jgi:hypothetical protein
MSSTTGPYNARRSARSTSDGDANAVMSASNQLTSELELKGLGTSFQCSSWSSPSSRAFGLDLDYNMQSSPRACPGLTSPAGTEAWTACRRPRRLNCILIFYVRFLYTKRPQPSTICLFCLPPPSPTTILVASSPTLQLRRRTISYSFAGLPIVPSSSC